MPSGTKFMSECLMPENSNELRVGLIFAYKFKINLLYIKVGRLL
jgi:hypothetical protein